MKKDQELENEIESTKSNWFLKLLMGFVPKEVNIEGKSLDSIITNAALMAGSVSAVASIPPGPIGWLTILPDLLAVTKIQMNLIFKIAKYYGQEDKVTKTTIALVFARFTGVQAVISEAQREVGKRIFEQTTIKASEKIIMKGLEKVNVLVIERMTYEPLRKLLQKISQRIAGQVSSKIIGRWLIGISSVIFGTLSYKNTKKIAAVAVELFSKQIELSEPKTCPYGHYVNDDANFCPECGSEVI